MSTNKILIYKVRKQDHTYRPQHGTAFQQVRRKSLKYFHFNGAHKTNLGTEASAKWNYISAGKNNIEIIAARPRYTKQNLGGEYIGGELKYLREDSEFLTSAF